MDTNLNFLKDLGLALKRGKIVSNEVLEADSNSGLVEFKCQRTPVLN